MGENLPMEFTLGPSWTTFLAPEFNKPYFNELKRFLSQKHEKTIYPPQDKIFEAFRLTDLANVKVVILGQDPYHGRGQAHGLAFSVPLGVKPPPSLVNIFKELHNDLGSPIPSHGNLESWAQEGVLLLNTVLTVEEGKAGSHHKKGWEIFTDRVIQILDQEKNHLVFILWGAPAQKKALALDEKKHLILKAPHPSPLSVYRGFYGSKPFSQTNRYLKSHGIPEINWKLT